MTDSDPFTAAQEKHDSRTRCKFCPAVAELSATRRNQLHDALFGKTRVNGKKVAYSVIIDVLNSWGIQITANTILSKHHTGKTLSPMCREYVKTKWEKPIDE